MFDSVKISVVAVLALIFGTGMFVAWLATIPDLMGPIVGGTIVARTPIEPWGIKRVDFTIALDEDPNIKVHSFAQRYLMNTVPNRVRFHYSGDPTRAVTLHEHEENPLWIALISWAIGGGLGGFVLAGRYWSWRKTASMSAPPHVQQRRQNR